ncbi:COP9 signalosome complex subunit 8 [Oryza brachyantha]|uniref:COP9 signalosome complex subunit 8 n=1 Tax=Oryza brachyantha TaxID=4533 RepID=J3LXW3_ORYBR|nr:COP9 signalosome complex subunit 8 [Oryza brachyantha]
MDLSAVHAALSDGSYAAVALLCDDLFLEAASRGAATDDWPYAVHLLAHLYLSDLNSARFLWKSTPQEAKDARPELAAVWRIGQCLWNRDYAGVYTAAQGFEWGPQIADFVSAFLESYRKRIFQLLTSAYSTISVADVAHFMGMNEEDATNYAMQNGWSLDASAKMLTVVKPKVKTNQKLDASKLQRLTECVFHLEH